MSLVKVLESNWKALVGVIAAFIVGGALVSVSMSRTIEKEKKAQEAYFSIEKKLIDLRAKKNAPEATEKKEASVDFTAVKKDFEKFVADYSGTVASQMAALYLASLSAEEKNFDSALATLQKVENKENGLVNTLVQQQIGQLLADKDKCSEAIAIWQKIVDRKQASFLHNEIKIQQALCYTRIKDFKKAEEILTNMANQNVNAEMGMSSTSKEAEKYLRLLQFKKSSGT